ncbi:MAG: 3-hydroxyacyl-ACP dehydratase FabZ [Elusimicrobiota bacterium]
MKKNFNMNKKKIKNIIPHREPYLMIDGVDVVKEGHKGIGYKKLTGNEYFFQGHFPDIPVMPGVLIVETIVQTAMVVAERGDLKMDRVEKVKFRQTIEPGDMVEIEVELKEKKDGKFKFFGQVFVEKNLAASGNIILSYK